MRRLIVATRNKGKIAEIKRLLEGLPFDVISMEQAGMEAEIEETGNSFQENSAIKAKAVFDAVGGVVLADDSGLEVDYLNGAPGIYSSRFAGEGASDSDRVIKLLALLDGVPKEKRAARFVCAATVILEDGTMLQEQAVRDGYIADEPKGSNGFGYDPVFFLPDFNMTMAEIDSETKNKISHRAKALQLIKNRLIKN
ncbi:MAG: XTP/dITP diphosphatase [Eubacteriales bacterium]|nr:XTP/dITP diphosphatase [Eubacteriales bacterium]